MLSLASLHWLAACGSADDAALFGCVDGTHTDANGQCGANAAYIGSPGALGSEGVVATTMGGSLRVSAEFPNLFDYEEMKVLPTFISHLYGSRMPVAEITLTNTGPAATFVVSTDLPIYGEAALRTVSLGADESRTISTYPIIDFAQLFSNTATLPAELSITISSEGTPVYGQSFPLQITGRNTVFWSRKDKPVFAYIATMVTPQDRGLSIQSLLRGASTRFPNAQLVGYAGLGWLSPRTFQVQPGDFTDERVYVVAGETPTVTVTSVAGDFGAADPFAIMILDDASYQAWRAGGIPRPCAASGSAGPALTCAAPATGGWYHYVYKNKPWNSVPLNIVRQRPMTKWETSYRQSQAIFEEMRERGIVYINLPGSGFFSAAQSVRYPSETVASASANCLDGALAFASAWEALGMEPVILYGPGHAFPAVKCWAQTSDCLVPVETTMIGGDATFEQAYERGLAEIKSWTDAGTLTSVDVLAARAQGITPAPM